MITDSLFDQILINPVVRNDADTLYIISGYSTPAMVFNHFEQIRKLRKRIVVNLLIGMAPLDGITRRNHEAFKQLMNVDLCNSFFCSYIASNPAVHSKLYMWYHQDEPLFGYIGSANYTQRAFKGILQKEALGEISATVGKEYYDALSNRSIFCTHEDAELLAFATTPTNDEQRQTTLQTDVQGLDSVVLSFINRSGVVSERSGLNWGQRPELNREPNQAYLAIPADIARSGFFPPIRQHFTVNTDDGRILIFSRAQDNGKSIHTPHNNSLIGEYFRRRLGLANGVPVLMEHLVAYGRTDVTFFKIDEESYYMDFSVQGNNH